MTQEELARRARLSKATVHRLEKGVQSGNRKTTLRGLAKALDVEPGVLTGQLPIPAPSATDRGEPEPGPQQLNIRVNAASRNALMLVALRYRMPMTRIVELAPYLFVCAAEASLARRRSKLAELEALFERADAQRYTFPHLPFDIVPTFVADNIIHAEKKSIEQRDILANSLPDQLFAHSAPVATAGEASKYYDVGEHNPFLHYLREAEPPNSEIAEIEWFDADAAIFSVCLEDACAFAGGDEQLGNHIVNGLIRLHEMPRELFAADAIETRVKWLQEKSPGEEVADEVLDKLFPRDVAEDLR